MTEKRRSPLGILFLTLFLDLVGFSIIFPLFPDMLEHYFKTEPQGSIFERLVSFLASFAPDSEAGKVQTAALFGGVLGSLYSMLQFLFAPVWGSLSDRIGRRPVLLASILGSAVSYLVWIFSGSFALLIASRLLGGCMSGNIATVSAAVADVTTRENRAKGMGVIGAAFGLGFILGPALGAAASLMFDPAAKFPELVRWGIHPFSAPALVAFLLTAANLIWVYTHFDETLKPEHRGRAREGARSINPAVLFKSFGIPGVTRTNQSYFIFILAFSGIEFTLTFFAKDSFDWGRKEITYFFVYVGVLLALIQGGLVRRLAPRFGERKLVLFGLVCLVLAFVTVGTSGSSQVRFYIGLTLMALGSGFSITCLTSLASLYAPEERQGEALGVFRSLGALARALGPLIFCTLYWKFGPMAPGLAAACVLLVPLGVAAGLKQPQKTMPEASGPRPAADASAPAR